MINDIKEEIRNINLMINLKKINDDNTIEEEEIVENNDVSKEDDIIYNQNCKLKYNELIEKMKKKDENKYYNKNEFYCNILLLPLNIDFSNKISILSLISYCYQENKKYDQIYNIARKFEKNEKYLNAVDPLFFLHVYFRAGHFLGIEKNYFYARKYIIQTLKICKKKSKIQELKIRMCEKEYNQFNVRLISYIAESNNNFDNDDYFNPGKAHDIKNIVDSILEGKNNLEIDGYLFVISKNWLIRLKYFLEDYLNSIEVKKKDEFFKKAFELEYCFDCYLNNNNINNIANNKNNNIIENKENEFLSPFPGPINNYELVSFKDHWIDNINIDENYFIKKDMKLNEDYFLINTNDWSTLKFYFDSTNEILRKKNNLDLIQLKFILFDKRINEENNNLDILKLKYIQINKKASFKQLKEKIINISNSNLPKSKNEKKNLNKNIITQKEVNFYILEKSKKELLIEICFSFIINNQKYDSVFLNKLDFSDSIDLEDFFFEYKKDKHILIIEIIEEGQPHFFEDLKLRMKNEYKCTECNRKINHINDKYNCSFCNLSLFCGKNCADKSKDHIKLDKKLTEIKQSKFNLYDLLSLPLNSLLSGHITRGIVGLKNLGNTCYINSSIQCLSNTEDLTKYFLKGDFSKEINKVNSGSKGEISYAYYKLINNMWKGTNRVIYPDEFRAAFCRKEEYFCNNEQQDAQEFLLSLLNNLHDDLNRVTNKQYKELNEKQNNETDEQASNRYWEYHKSRENSIIVDLFQGQYKSSIKCSVCQNESVTFDTYMNLQLPIPSKKIQNQIRFLLNNGTSIKLSIKMDENTEIKDIIKKAIHNLDYKKYLDYLTSHKIKNSIFNYNNKEVPQDLLYNNIIVTEFDNDLKLTSIFNTSYKNISNIIDNKNNRNINNDENIKEIKNKNNKKINNKDNENKNIINQIPFDKEKIINIYENKKYREIVLFEKSINSNNDVNNIDIFVYPVTEAAKKGIIGSNFKTLKLSYPIIITLNKNNTLYELESAIKKQFSKFLISSKIESNSILIGFPHFSDKWKDFKISDKKCPICDETYNKNIKSCLLFKYYKDKKKKILDLMEKIGTERPLILFAESQEYDLNKQIYKGIKLRTVESKKESEMKKELTIYDSLELFHKEEILDGEEKWYCGKCGKHQKATKKMEIYKTPYYLIVQLKRFKQRGNLMRTILGNKNETLIDYKEILYLNDFVSGADKEKSIYLLYGVIIHKKILNGGHYVSLCKNNGDWLIYNDSEVGYCNNPIHKDAYLLFYKRKSID